MGKILKLFVIILYTYGILYLVYASSLFLFQTSGGVGIFLFAVFVSWFLLAFPIMYFIKEIKYVRKGGFKYFFISHPQEEDDVLKKRLRFKQKELNRSMELNTRTKLAEEIIINRELSRTGVEKFKSTRIGNGWLVLPYMFCVITFFVIVYELFTFSQASSESHIQVIIIAVIVFLIPFILNSIRDRWDQELRFKADLKFKHPNYRIWNYDDDCIYSDSEVELLLYKILKLYCYAVTIFGSPILIVILFYWLGTISIAPTTIIIILLIIIISNQNK